MALPILRRPTLLISAILMLLIAVTGCGGGGAASATQTSYTAIIDVRTPSEYAAGHVEGARNIDVQAPTFTTEIAALPKSGTFLVYCHSGNRAARAVDLMHGTGLTATSGGGLTDMQSAGYHVTS